MTGSLLLRRHLLPCAHLQIARNITLSVSWWKSSSLWQYSQWDTLLCEFFCYYLNIVPALDTFYVGISDWMTFNKHSIRTSFLCWELKKMLSYPSWDLTIGKSKGQIAAIILPPINPTFPKTLRPLEFLISFSHNLHPLILSSLFVVLHQQTSHSWRQQTRAEKLLFWNYPPLCLASVWTVTLESINLPQTKACFRQSFQENY